ncbi:MAG: DUF4097 family beta strand repeat-containing protein [Dehalococcoidia bacterium]
METSRLDLPVGVTLRLQSRSGKVLVIAEAREDIEVETDDVETRVEDGGGALMVRSGRGGTKTLTVRAPIDTDVQVGTQSGSVRMQGKLGAISITTMSGDIEVDDAEELDARSLSGKVTVGRCRGRCRLNAVSGRIYGGDVDTAYAQSVSGSIKFDRVLGDVRAKTVSGSIDLNALGDGVIALKTISGKMRIVLPAGTEPHTLFKTRGSVRCDFAEGRDCRIEAHSLSGSIEVVPA